MRLTVKELRMMIERSMSPRGSMERSEIFDTIEYSAESNEFRDRWGHPLPSKPEGMDAETVRAWLDSNGVSSVEVRGKKMSPDHFTRFVSFMKGGASNIPIVKGSDSTGSTKTGDIPIVRGTPAKQRRHFRAEV